VPEWNYQAGDLRSPMQKLHGANPTKSQAVNVSPNRFSGSNNGSVRSETEVAVPDRVFTFNVPTFYVLATANALKVRHFKRTRA
jgi:hypothetical protein